MWVLENALGEVVTWYSEAEMQKYKQALEGIKKLLSQIDENNWLHTGRNIYMDDRCVKELKIRILNMINAAINESEEK